MERFKSVVDIASGPVIDVHPGFQLPDILHGSAVFPPVVDEGPVRVEHGIVGEMPLFGIEPEFLEHPCGNGKTVDVRFPYTFEDTSLQNHLRVRAVDDLRPFAGDSAVFFLVGGAPDQAAPPDELRPFGEEHSEVVLKGPARREIVVGQTRVRHGAGQVVFQHLPGHRAVKGIVFHLVFSVDTILFLNS